MTVKEKIQSLTKKFGIRKIIKSVRKVKIFLDITDGLDFLSEDELIKFIKECLNITGDLNYTDLNTEPVYRFDNDEGIHQIEGYTHFNVIFQVWGGYDRMTDMGEYKVPYEKLSKEELMEILENFLFYIEDFDMV